MKKLGLRAVAGSLAVLMVASVFAPAKVANAADMLVTAAAPKTLVITADMVDDDGEIVISNENWDRIVIGNDVVAKDIYFDEVDVDELVVESGSKSRVQLWEVDAAQVTVQEPEFNEISLKDILPLLADKETQQAALNMYMENKQANEAAAKLVPTIVTKEGAKVESVVARANATLDFAEGDVEVVALEASDKLDRAKVTLKNYDGDVTYKGNDKFSSMTLKNVNSTISLTVDESTDKNYFTVTGKNSLVEKAEVAGNAQVALDAPMGVVEISEKATAAQVTILDSAEEMNVASKGAKVELTMNANVAVANVTADNVKVEGQGTLKEANLEGKGAYVSTNGTKVEGENTYVKPVYVEKPEDIEHTFATLGAGGWGYTRLGATDGGETYKLTGGYSGEVFYVLPKSVDACLYSEAVIKVKTEPGQTVTVKLTHEGADKDAWGNPVAFFSKAVTGEAEVVVPLTLHAGKMIDQVRFQSGGEEVTATLFDVKFKLNPNGPVEPIVPPADGTLCTPNTWEIVAFQDVDFRQLAGKTVKITLEAMRLGAETCPVARGQFANGGWVMLHEKEIGKEWTDFGVEEYVVPASFATSPDKIYYGLRTLSETADYSGSLIYYRNFSVEVLDGGETGDGNTGAGNTTPTPGPGEDDGDDPVVAPNTYTFKDLKEVQLWDATTSVDATTGAITMTFKGQWKQAFYEIPTDVDTTKLESVTINGLEGSAYAIKLQTAEEFAAGGDAVIVKYDNTTVETSGSAIKYIVFMSNDSAATADAPQILKVDSVTFNMKEEENPTVPEVAPNTYTFKDLKEVQLWDATTSVDATTGAITMTFKGQWKQAFYEIPADVDTTKLESVTINGLEGSAYAIKLQTAEEFAAGGDAAIVKYDNTTVETNGSVIKYIVFMSNDSAATADAPQVLKVDSITFNMKDVEEEEEKIAEFFIAKDIAFTDKLVGDDGYGNINASVADVYLDADNFKNMLPEVLKADETIANKFTTLEGIVEMVDYFEVEIILTEGTAVAGKESYAPQAQVYMQSSDWAAGTFGAVQGNVGQPSEGNPTTGTFQHSTDLIKDWTSPTVAKIGIQIFNAESGTTVSGTYSIKVVLN